MGLQMPNLDDAMEALAANQTDLFLKEMDAALEDLEKLKEMAKNIQQLQQQAEKLGKDLAEQLENGQPELAQSTMQKMIDQLNAANLSPEQMEKMIDEVSKAVDPAGNYGKVAEHLKQAAKQMQGGQKSDAAKSLAEASKELDKLMQQLGDAQELAETLQNLEEASRALLEVGHQRDVIGIMQTRAELYDYLGYQEFERKLDELFAASAADENEED